MRALVTGASGFIGKALAVELVKQGWEVRLLLRNSSRSIPELLQGCKISCYDFQQGDLPSLRSAVNQCDVIFHAAAIRNRWGTNSQDFYTVNVLGTDRLLQACLGQVSRFVYLSSVGVFGYPGVLNIDESFPLIDATSSWDYHTSKVAAEKILSSHSNEIETVIIRPTISYGPGDETGMVTRLIELISHQWFFRVGDGHNNIHLTHIDDLVQGLIQAGIHPAAAGQTFILSGPQPVQIFQLLNQIELLLQRKISKLYLPAAAADFLGGAFEGLYPFAAKLTWIDPKQPPPITRQMVQTFCANRSFSSLKAQQLIGFHPTIDLSEGLPDTIQWMRSMKRLSYRQGVN